MDGHHLYLEVKDLDRLIIRVWQSEFSRFSYSLQKSRRSFADIRQVHSSYDGEILYSNTDKREGYTRA